MVQVRQTVPVRRPAAWGNTLSRRNAGGPARFPGSAGAPRGRRRTRGGRPGAAGRPGGHGGQRCLRRGHWAPDGRGRPIPGRQHHQEPGRHGGAPAGRRAPASAQRQHRPMAARPGTQRPEHHGPRTAPAHQRALRSPSWAWAAGAVVSTISDLARFYTALLTGRLLSPPLLHQMLTSIPDKPAALIICI